MTVTTLGAIAAAFAATLMSATATGQPAPAASAVPVFAPIHPLAGGEKVVGDPDKAGAPFVVRLRELPGSIVPPHIHHFDENITIVEGTWRFGIGPEFDAAKLHELPVGSFVFIPAGTPMFGYAREGVTVQIHGIGPFEQHWVAPLYTLTAAGASDTEGAAGVDPKRFRFHADQAVRSPRGDGRIQEGFATGALIQYQVLKADGQLVVAQEKELTAR